MNSNFAFKFLLPFFQQKKKKVYRLKIQFSKTTKKTLYFLDRLSASFEPKFFPILQKLHFFFAIFCLKIGNFEVFEIFKIKSLLSETIQYFYLQMKNKSARFAHFLSLTCVETCKSRTAIYS